MLLASVYLWGRIRLGVVYHLVVLCVTGMLLLDQLVGCRRGGPVFSEKGCQCVLVLVPTAVPHLSGIAHFLHPSEHVGPTLMRGLIMRMDW